MTNPQNYADKTWQLRPKVERTRKIAPLTSLAKKYSHPTYTNADTSHSPLYGTKKSGLTPLSPGFQDLRKRRIHNYQKRRLYGFSAGELESLGVLAGVNGDDGGRRDPYDESDGWTNFVHGTAADGYGGRLDNPVHPLYARGNWEKRKDIPRHRGPIPIRGEVVGYWLAENDAVWRVLEPCVQLASLLITNAKHFPWWDALIYGDFFAIADSRRGFEDMNKALYSFHKRSESEYMNAQNILLLQSKLRNAADKIHFYLWSGYCLSETGAVTSDTGTFGITGTSYSREAVAGHISVGLAIEMLQPLVTGGLNEDERLYQQFRIAATLVHETAHAVWRHHCDDLTFRIDGEPYFEGEILPELGWSLEDKMWGGQPLDISSSSYNAGGPGIPNIGVMKSSFFTECNEEYSRSTFTNIGYINDLPPSIPDPYYNIEYWPVPTFWFKDLFKKEKWDHMIKNFGAAGTMMAPLTFGTQFDTKDPDPRNLTQLAMPAAMLTSMYVPAPIMASLDDKGREAVTRENTRLARASQILDSMGQMSALVNATVFPSQAATMPTIDPPETYSCVCPRYEEIKKFCLDNRDPLKLAFDSMEFDIPEPTMYRYIRDRGSLNFSAETFRNFLHCCNTKKELFQYEPFPGTGMITKISNGWGPPTPFRIPRRPNPNKLMLYNFRAEINRKDFRTSMYMVFGEFRDIDFETLRCYVNRGLPPDEQITRDEIADIVNTVAEGEKFIYDRDLRQLTLGPRGIARMLWPIDEADRTEYSRSWIIKKRDRQIAGGILVVPKPKVPTPPLSSASGSPTSSQGNMTLSQFMVPPAQIAPPKAVTAPKTNTTSTGPSKPIVPAKPNTAFSPPPRPIVPAKSNTTFVPPTSPPKPVFSPKPNTSSGNEHDNDQMDIEQQLSDAMQGVLNTGKSIAGMLSPPKALSSFTGAMAGYFAPPKNATGAFSSLTGILSPPPPPKGETVASKLQAAKKQLEAFNKAKAKAKAGDAMDVDVDEDSDGDYIITEGLTVSPK